MSKIFEATHEVGDFSEYTSSVTDSGRLAIAGGAALAGTSYGMSAQINTTTAIYAKKTFTAFTSNLYRVRHYIDPNAATIANYDVVWVCQVRSASDAQYNATIELYRQDAQYKVRAGIREDDYSLDYTSLYNITDAEHWVEILVERASSSVASDAELTLWIDDVQQENLTGKDWYDLAKPDAIRLGATAIPSGSSGTIYLDELVINDDGGYIGPVAGHAGALVSTVPLKSKVFGGLAR